MVARENSERVVATRRKNRRIQLHLLPATVVLIPPCSRLSQRPESVPSTSSSSLEDPRTCRCRQLVAFASSCPPPCAPSSHRRGTRTPLPSDVRPLEPSLRLLPLFPSASVPHLPAAPLHQQHSLSPTPPLDLLPPPRQRCCTSTSLERRPQQTRRPFSRPRCVDAFFPHQSTDGFDTTPMRHSPSVSSAVWPTSSDSYSALCGRNTSCKRTGGLFSPTR